MYAINREKVERLNKKNKNVCVYVFMVKGTLALKGHLQIRFMHNECFLLPHCCNLLVYEFCKHIVEKVDFLSRQLFQQHGPKIQHKKKSAGWKVFFWILLTQHIKYLFICVDVNTCTRTVGRDANNNLLQLNTLFLWWQNGWMV